MNRLTSELVQDGTLKSANIEKLQRERGAEWGDEEKEGRELGEKPRVQSCTSQATKEHVLFIQQYFFAHL